MSTRVSRIAPTLVAAATIAVMGLAPTSQAFAEKPAHAGKPSHAGKGGKHGGKGKAAKHGKHGKQDRGDVSIQVTFGEDGRAHVRSHYRNEYAAQPCPPGLAKKRNGCLPPGQAKKRYAKGDIIPDEIVLSPIPGRLEVRLKPLPRGYVYRYVDGQVLVVAEAAKKVIDAVVLLSSL